MRVVSVATVHRADDDSRAAHTRSVAAVIVLALVSLSAYFYWYLYGVLGRLDETAPGAPERRAVRATRWCVTAGLGIQFVAVLALLAGVAPVLTDPEGHVAFWNALEQGRLVLPSEPPRANALSTLLNWGGWVVFWGPLFAFLARMQAEREPTGAASFALVLIGFRLLVGLLDTAGPPLLAASVGPLDAIVYLVLVGCCVSATNAILLARGAGGTTDASAGDAREMLRASPGKRPRLSSFP